MNGVVGFVATACFTVVATVGVTATACFTAVGVAATACFTAVGVAATACFTVVVPIAAFMAVAICVCETSPTNLAG